LIERTIVISPGKALSAKNAWLAGSFLCGRRKITAAFPKLTKLMKKTEG
jgi:hypothetical protein